MVSRREKKVYSEPRFLQNKSELQVEGDREKSEFLEMIDQAINQHQLKIKEGVEVQRIRKRADHDFEVEVTGGKTLSGSQRDRRDRSPRRIP